MFALGSRILVVDDMSTMRKLVIKALKEIGFYNVIEAPDGGKGWDALISASPKVDVVISDWTMPVCTGVEFLKKVRADQRFKGLPFIMLTAESEKQQVVTALSAGVSAYVIKPFNAETLKEQLERASQVAA